MTRVWWKCNRVIPRKMRFATDPISLVYHRTCHFHYTFLHTGCKLLTQTG